MGYNTDGWTNIGDAKDTYRKALLKINNNKKAKCRLVSVTSVKEIVDVIIHDGL